MESSEYTQRTLDFFEQRLFPEFGPHVGVVIQSALRRSTDDIEHLIGLGARVRLCKGAYLEPDTVAFPDKKDVDAHYVRLLEQLLLRGNYPGIATHDETDHRARRELRAGQPDRSRAFRIPDALRGAPRSAGRPSRPRLADAGVRSLRHPVVSRT